LRKGDALGLMAFDAAAQVLLPVGPPPARERLQGVLDAVEPHGPTELQATLERALAVAGEATARVRCVVLVSDGQAERLDAAGLRRRYGEADVTLSVLMTGSDAAAVARLQELAGKHFHRVTELPELASRFLDALREAVHERFVAEGRFAVQTRGPVEVASGVNAAGQVRGYVRAAPKDAATVEWTTGDERDPLLARWQYGLGRAVAFTSSVGTPWDAELWGEQAAKLWGQAVRWAARPARTPGFEAEVAEEGGGFCVAVRVEKDGRFVNGLELAGRLASPEGKAVELDLPQRAPGEYAAEFPAPVQGAYRLTVVEKGKGQRLSVGVVRNYAREWEAFGVDRVSCEAVARQGRGRVLAGLEELRELERERAEGWVALEWVFVAAALVLFVGEVGASVVRARRASL
jgi:hypothetical protein